MLEHMLLVILVFYYIEMIYGFFSQRNLTEVGKLIINTNLQMIEIRNGEISRKDKLEIQTVLIDLVGEYTTSGFYFIVITLTQIGNQDPMLADLKKDYLLLSICMMVGIVLFNYTHASLTSYIGGLIVSA